MSDTGNKSKGRGNGVLIFVFWITGFSFTFGFAPPLPLGWSPTIGTVVTYLFTWPSILGEAVRLVAGG